MAEETTPARLQAIADLRVKVTVSVPAKCPKGKERVFAERKAAKILEKLTDVGGVVSVVVLPLRKG
jgi:hypothetical protein